MQRKKSSKLLVQQAEDCQREDQRRRQIGATREALSVDNVMARFARQPQARINNSEHLSSPLAPFDKLPVCLNPPSSKVRVGWSILSPLFRLYQPIVYFAIQSNQNLYPKTESGPIQALRLTQEKSVGILCSFRSQPCCGVPFQSLHRPRTSFLVYYR